MDINLSTKHCTPCDSGAGHLMKAEIEILLKKVPSWNWKNFHELEKTFKFKNFAEALTFTNKVGALAEAEGHHPDIELSWGKVKIKLFTHALDGLCENDFILAAKIDALLAVNVPC